MNKREVTIIGTGALGSALARELVEQKITVKSIYNRTVGKAETLAQDLAIEQFGTFPGSADVLGDLIFITVPDDLISNVSEQLARQSGINGDATVVHCSGNHASAILDAVHERGCSVGAFHPMQTFTVHSKPGIFKNIYVTVEGDPHAVEVLGDLAEQIGSRVLKVEPGDKPLLHAGAVFASNYLVALLDAAAETGGSGTLTREEVLRAYLPLVRTTIENCEEGELSKILSGPVARGDVNTVNKHLQLLKHKPGLFSLYKLMGMRTFQLAEQSGRLSDVAITEMKKMLNANE